MIASKEKNPTPMYSTVKQYFIMELLFTKDGTETWSTFLTSYLNPLPNQHSPSRVTEVPARTPSDSQLEPGPASANPDKSPRNRRQLFKDEEEVSTQGCVKAQNNIQTFRSKQNTQHLIHCLPKAWKHWRWQNLGQSRASSGNQAGNTPLRLNPGQYEIQGLSFTYPFQVTPLHKQHQEHSARLLNTLQNYTDTSKAT